MLVFIVFLENSESVDMHILSGGSKLQIARSQLSDSGTYTCLASNVEGKARKNYQLIMQGTEAFIKLNKHASSSFTKLPSGLSVL